MLAYAQSKILLIVVSAYRTKSTLGVQVTTEVIPIDVVEQEMRYVHNTYDVDLEAARDNSVTVLYSDKPCGKKMKQRESGRSVYFPIKPIR